MHQILYTNIRVRRIVNYGSGRIKIKWRGKQSDKLIRTAKITIYIYIYPRSSSSTPHTNPSPYIYIYTYTHVHTFDGQFSNGGV